MRCLQSLAFETGVDVPMNPEHKEARCAEILDGQTVWDRNKVCAGDDDKFRTEYIDPLKMLQAEGKFEIRVITRNIRGRANVPIGVQITSAINYD